MSNLDIVTAASEPAFYMRVCYAALKAAQAVAAEPAGKHKNYANRIAYALVRDQANYDPARWA